MSQLRRARSGQALTDSVFSTISGGDSNIVDFNWSSDTVEPLIDDYPYSGQKIFRGSFTHLQEHPFSENDVRETDFEFLYREESRIFILDTNGPSEAISDAFSAINSRLPNGLRIQPGLSGSRSAIWGFIQTADEIGEIKVWKDNDIVPVDQIESSKEELMGETIVWDAELFFDNPEDSGQNLVIYNEESLSSATGSIEELEYVIQLFEKTIMRGA
ncbi:hypothetical protein [Haloarchaeobius litoreus]|uniref:Peptidase family S41 n=1 Tax=Haloarchaeobius litoreus TaxID=755306 RepID=A0ABD6DH48_9EURY|nr:hypothetical protein [Haloarchaeobius litoreus]